ncbi:MOSC N-terminal beta barrel domain-containing protein [Streptomyces sp. NPDC054796]
MTAAPPSPRVSRLSVTPVKGLGVTHPDEVGLTPSGVRGDRAFFMADAAGRLLSMTRTGAWAAYTAAFDPAAGVLTVTGPDGTRVTGEVRLGDPVKADFFHHHKVPGRVVEGPWVVRRAAGPWSSGGAARRFLVPTS